MTKEEILAMEAGKELDRAVAKEIFGYEIPDDIIHGQRMADAKTDKLFLGTVIIGTPILCYSTDISAAWQVVEKMNKRYGVMLTVFDPSQFRYPAEKALCEVCDPLSEADGTIIGQSYGNSVPEAICKAALIAKNKEVNHDIQAR